jgi:hypothetical protein
VCRAWSGRETHFDARGTRFRIRMPLTLKTRHGPVQRGRKVYRTFYTSDTSSVDSTETLTMICDVLSRWD